MASPLFPWLIVDAQSVLRAARLEAHEMGQTLSEEDFQGDADDELDTAAGDITLAIQGAVKELAWPFTASQWSAAYPDFAQSERDRRRTLQTNQANKVVKALAVASLRRQNGSEESIKVSQATSDGRGEAVIGNARIGSADAMLARLLADVTEVVRAIRSAASARSSSRVGAILIGEGD